MEPALAISIGGLAVFGVIFLCAVIYTLYERRGMRERLLS